MTNQDPNFDNSLNYSEEFNYPSESSSKEREEEIEHLADEIAVKKTAEFISRLLSIVIPAQNTKIQLVAFAVASGVNVGFLLNCEDTLTSISKAIGCTRAALSAAVITISEQYNIKTYTGKHNESKDTYQHTNYRKPATIKENKPKSSRVERSTKRKSWSI